MKRIIVAEDETAIREFVVINLQRGGYEVIEADNGEAALLEYVASEFSVDVVILDIMMPVMDGLEVCKKIRELSDTVGIILLTAKTQESDKVNGLIIGADDYITKPFSISELMARVDSLCRRVEINSRLPKNQSGMNSIVSGDFTLNLRNRTLEKCGTSIELTQVEFQILEYFFINPGAALSRTSILNRVWGSEYVGEEKIVDVNVRRLRIKIETEPSNPKHLITIWGIGYKWLG
jgi:two-component system, OmpR family, response regulator RegX3